MDFQFNDEQKMFQQSVRELLEKEFAPIVDERDPKGPLSREEGIDVMKKLKKVGVGLDPAALARRWRIFSRV